MFTMYLYQAERDNPQESQRNITSTDAEVSVVDDEALCRSSCSSCVNEDEELMAAVQRIQRQAALSATVNPWCYQPPATTLPPSLLFGLQGMFV